MLSSILKKNIEALHNVAKALLDRETITGNEMKEVIQMGSLAPLKTEEKQKKRLRRRSKTDSKS